MNQKFGQSIVATDLGFKGGYKPDDKLPVPVIVGLSPTMGSSLFVNFFSLGQRVFTC